MIHSYALHSLTNIPLTHNFVLKCNYETIFLILLLLRFFFQIFFTPVCTVSLVMSMFRGDVPPTPHLS